MLLVQIKEIQQNLSNIIIIWLPISFSYDIGRHHQRDITHFTEWHVDRRKLRQQKTEDGQGSFGKENKEVSYYLLDSESPATITSLHTILSM